MYVPSAMTVWRLASGGAMRGRMRQHHAIRLRRARASPAESAALWDDGPSSQERNSSSVRSRLRRRCGIVELNRQAGHFHRWTPLPVRPFFFIARPHTGHLFALLDGVLTPSSPPPGAHHFPRDKNDRPTRLLPQGRATVISTTKVPIGPGTCINRLTFKPGQNPLSRFAISGDLCKPGQFLLPRYKCQSIYAKTGTTCQFQNRPYSADSVCQTI